MSDDSAARRSIGSAFKQVLNQVGRLLEEEDPRALLSDAGPLSAALQAWRQIVETQTSGVTIERARALEQSKLELMGKVGTLTKECADLRERNAQLREELVRLNKKEQEHKQKLLDAEFQSGGIKAEAKTLDLEVRELRRRVRELEGGPPLTPAEAAPRSLDALQSLHALFRKPQPGAPSDASGPPASGALLASGEISSDEPVEPTSASGGGRPPARKAAAKKAPARKAAAKKAPARKAAARKAMKAPVKKSPAKKVPAKKAAANKVPAKKAAANKVPAKKAAANKVPAKKAAAKKVPAKKVPAKKVPAKKVPAKKAAARKATARKAAAKRTAKKAGNSQN